MQIKYGIGGYDESKPNNNVIEIIQDNVQERVISAKEFYDRFTELERLNIHTAALQNAQILSAITKLTAYGYAVLTANEVIILVNNLESLNLIGQGRAAEILR